jgi:diaminopimelate epimerase
MSLAFEKWEGLGNHFVLLESLPNEVTVQELCDPRRGVGADGVIVLGCEPPTMTIFNADGSRAAMCGNGLRCAARWFAERGVDLSQGIATDSGVMGVGAIDDQVAVVVGQPSCLGQGVFEGLTFSSVDIGNPHAIFIDPPASFDLEAVGEAMQTHPDFADGVNVHEVRTGSSVVIVVPYERGVGLTQACGTGAAASAFAVQAEHNLAWPISTELPGGVLHFEPDESGALWMTGPARQVFTGTW